MKKYIACLLIVCLAACLCACGGEHTGSGKPRVVCTLFPQYDFVRQIAGDLADTVLLLPPGTESHAFDPTPTDILNIGKADLFIYIGDAMETWAGGVMAEIDRDKTVVLNVSDALGLHLSTHADHADEHASDEEDGIDPHIWTSPVLAKRMAQLLLDTLMELDAQNADAYAQNAGVLFAQLTQLDKTFRAVTANAPLHTIVVGSRFALRNFTEEYGLDYLAAFDSCTEESEPSAAALASIVQAIETQNLPVVFFEELIVPTTAQTIAAETGTQTLLFHSCHNVTRDEFDAGETYVTLMQQNARNLAQALRANEEAA